MKVNGETVALTKETSLSALLEEMDYLPTRIAVERNGEIVPKSQYDSCMLAESDVLEIVCFMGGG